MLIYLDANIVQYCADYQDFIFGDTDNCPVNEPKLRKEIVALRQLVELDQFGNWDFAAPDHLMQELRAGKPSPNQRGVYRILRKAWEDTEWVVEFPQNANEISKIDQFLVNLNLQDSQDRRHLAEALGLNASWFLTNDQVIIQKCRGKVRHTRVSRPSECIGEISIGLFLR